MWSLCRPLSLQQHGLGSPQEECSDPVECIAFDAMLRKFKEKFVMVSHVNRLVKV